MKYIFLLLFLSAFYFLLSTKPLFAQTKASTIDVMPQIVHLDLSVDPAQAEYEYTNNTSQTIELSLTMRDVKELEDRGIPGLLDENESQNYKYGLSAWAKFSNNNIVLEPGESKKITVFIDKTRLPYGGHYASVLAEIKQPQDKKEVNLRAVISTLLFVRTGSSYDHEEAAINSFLFDQDYLSFPTSASFMLKNTGNVDVTPHGFITITDPFGREVVRAIVNENSSITLPESERKYITLLSSKISILPPGIYKAKLDVNYGKKRIKTSKIESFFSLGSLTVDKIGILILIGTSITFLIFKFGGGKNRKE